MKKNYTFLFVSLGFVTFLNAQNNTIDSPCSHNEIMARHLEHNPTAISEMEENETFIKSFVSRLREEQSLNGIKKRNTQYTIPIVLHVFHNGDDGKIDMVQALSGLDIINTDFLGLNDDWNTIDPDFDGIKATLDIEFCLATIDPDGNPTTGVIYYENEDAMYNNIDLFQFAWDNYKYMNIYLPKYTGGGPSDFTAYTYYPSTTNSNNNRDGIFYSSIRWGYGSHSELDPGQEWASVGTHEVGHWLDLRHTFNNACNFPGDLVDDTPPTSGSGLEFSGCYNNDFSCGVPTNGENYMDYNVDCKKMFTQGQVERMTAALELPSRITLWSSSNLEATGCNSSPTSFANVIETNLITTFPNPANDYVNFKFKQFPAQLSIYNAQGKLIFENLIKDESYIINTSKFERGLYFYYSMFENKISNGKLVIN